jgi:iron complex outermembrane recepter protein
MLLSEALTLNLGYGYLDTQLGEEFTGSIDGTLEALTDQFSYAPEYSYTVGLNYARSLGNGELTAGVNYGYQDEFLASINQETSVLHDGYGLWSASLNWRDIRLAKLDGSFSLQLWGRNLADEEYTVSGGRAWSVFGAENVLTFGDPRTYGLTVSYRYD